MEKTGDDRGGRTRRHCDPDRRLNFKLTHYQKFKLTHYTLSWRWLDDNQPQGAKPLTPPPAAWLTVARELRKRVTIVEIGELEQA